MAADETISEKLRINGDESLTFFNPPENSGELLEGLTEDISISEGDPADVVLAFIEDAKQLKRNLLNLKSNTKKDGSLWIIWQKNNSKNDINRGFITDYAQLKNLKKVSEATIRNNWSAVQFKIN